MRALLQLSYTQEKLHYFNQKIYMDVKELLARYVAGEGDFSYSDLDGANLKFANLKFAKLNNSHFNCANLSGSDLSYTDLSHADLTGASLKNANLHSAYLVGAFLINADLSEANLSNANLTTADLRGANLNKTKLDGANLCCITVDGAKLLKEVNLISCSSLEGWDLIEADLKDLDLRKLKLPMAELNRANLSGVNLSGSDLFHASFEGANLSNANLSETNLCCANLNGAVLSGVNLQKALYDESTEFPKGFNPEKAGMVYFSYINEQKQYDLESQIIFIEEKLKNEGLFNPENIEDARERIERAIVQRRGQSSFRQQLLAAYDSQCAITGFDAEQALEAAHIYPYKGEETNRVWNGLLLRADIHTLFDLYLITVHSETKIVYIAPELKNTSYQQLNGREIKLPKDINLRPRKELLRWHFKQCKWLND